MPGQVVIFEQATHISILNCVITNQHRLLLHIFLAPVHVLASCTLLLPTLLMINSSFLAHLTVLLHIRLTLILTLLLRELVLLITLLISTWDVRLGMFGLLVLLKVFLGPSRYLLVFVSLSSVLCLLL